LNGRRAKALRRKVYGDHSLKAPRRYGRLDNGQIVLDDRYLGGRLRHLYQAAKADGR
jgi:hypothetical protein